MIEHLRTARDYALETRERTGTPELLPRPSQKQLATRLGISESNVSRCQHDKSARELALLWEWAADLDRVLAYSGRR